MVRLPEHRDQAEKDLQTIIADPKGDNAIAHRALAWARMDRKEFDKPPRNCSSAGTRRRDTWTHYYLALVKFRAAQSSGNRLKAFRT